MSAPNPAYVRAEDLKPGAYVIVTLTRKNLHGDWHVATTDGGVAYLPESALIGVARLYQNQQPVVDVEEIRRIALQAPTRIRELILGTLPDPAPEPGEPTGDDAALVDRDGSIWRRDIDGYWRVGNTRASFAQVRDTWGPLEVYRREAAP